MNQLAQLISRIKLIAFDFDGVFTNNKVYTQQDGSESICCWRSDGLGLARLKDAGVKIIIISTEQNPVVSARASKLNIACIQGVDDKLSALQDAMQTNGCSAAETAFVGNDINDLECLDAVGLPMVVADAHGDVIEHALYRTIAPGGHGAVREICDLIVKYQDRQ